MSQRILHALAVFCIGICITLSAYAGPYGFYMNEYVKPTDTLNVRSGPGTGYTSITIVPPGIAGTIIGGPTLANGYYWWRVTYPVQGITSWIAQNWLATWFTREVKNFSSGYVLVTHIDGTPLRARSGAGVDYSVLGTIPEGTVGRVIGGPIHNHAYVWWRVEWPNGVRGWSVQRFLKEATAPPPPDTTKPVITLLGSASVTIDYGASYTDPGATASDNVDGNITGRIVVTGLPISTTTPGTYYIRYNVTDTAGNKANEVVRTVTVRAPPQVPTPVTSITLIAGAIANGWDNLSWGVSVFTSGSIVYAGTHSLGLAYTAEWGELYLRRTPFSTNGLATLRLAVYGPSTGGQNPRIALVDDNGDVIKQVLLTDYVPGNALVAQTWYSVVIPLADLNGTDRMVSGIMVQSPTAPSGLFLDNMVFSTVAGSTYATPPSPPPATGASATLFADLIGSGWDSWSGGITYNPDSPHHYQGAKGLAVTYAEAWGGLYLRAKSFATAGYDALTLAIHGGTHAGQKLHVALRDENGTSLGSVPLGDYLPAGILTPDTWQEVRIPLADLNGLNRTITGFVLQSESPTTITLDEVRFIETTTLDTGVCND